MEMEEEHSVFSPCYYSVLGVNPDSSDDEIRRAYRKLAMQWHPDKWASKNPSLLAIAKRKFQQIQQAYSVLSNRNKRILYDSGLYDPDDEEIDEGFADFVQEMVSLMDSVKKEGKIYTMDELQGMLEDMTKCFEETTQWSRYNTPQESTFKSSHCYPHPFSLSSSSNPGSMNWLNSSGNSSNSPYSIGPNMGFTSLSAERGWGNTFPTFWQ